MTADKKTGQGANLTGDSGRGEQVTQPHDSIVDPELQTFLNFLHRGGSWANWWRLADRSSRWWPVGNPSTIPGATNIYFSVHPAADRRGDMQRTRIQDVAAINCLFSEYDAKDYGNKAATLEHVNELRPMPSVVVDSGGGYHCYWLLDEPYILNTDDKRDDAAALQAAWVAVMGGDLGAKDLARVFRVPGTTNGKYTPPRPVEWLRCDLDRTYTLAELRERIPAEPKTRQRGLTIPQTPGGYGAAALAGEINILARTAEGQRNGQLNRSAFALGQLIAGGELDRSDVERELLAEALGVGLDHAESVATIKSGLDAGAKEPRGAPEPTRGAPQDEAEQDGLPQVFVTNRPLRAISQDAMTALVAANDPPVLFVRSGQLVRIASDEAGRPRIDHVTEPILRGRMSRVANFYRVTGKLPKHVTPSRDVIGDILSIGSWSFPALEGVTESPILRPDGTILDRPGYDPATRLVYAPAPGFRLPRIPEQPTSADLGEAVAMIADAIGEFPYADAASRANAFALLLTPIIRQAIGGHAPLAILDAPQAGTGKTLLGDLTAVIATGRPGAMMTAPGRRGDDAEWRKSITSVLMEGRSVVLIDNLESALDSASLAAVLTTADWTDRILGRSEMIHLPQRATWAATGNNVRLGGDIPRRCYWIRLNAETDRPWQRTGFRHPDLIGYALDCRGDLLAALLTMTRAWYAAGRPVPDSVPHVGSFETWARTVGGILAHAGIDGFLDNQNELLDQIDDEGAQWRVFLTAWQAAYGDQAVTTTDLVQRMRDATVEADPEGAELAAALPDSLADGLTEGKGKSTFQRRIGNALRRRTDMYFGYGLHLQRAAKHMATGRVRWKVSTASTASTASSPTNVRKKSFSNPSTMDGIKVVGGQVSENCIERAGTDAVDAVDAVEPDRGYV